jgi:hypothetical protein
VSNMRPAQQIGTAGLRRRPIPINGGNAAHRRPMRDHADQ